MWAITVVDMGPERDEKRFIFSSLADAEEALRAMEYVRTLEHQSRYELRLGKIITA